MVKARRGAGSGDGSGGCLCLMDDSLATSYPLVGEPFARREIAVTAEPSQRRSLVVVLGMHRSGTSLCAHMLSVMGVDMTDDIGASPPNPQGHWERREIAA